MSFSAHVAASILSNADALLEAWRGRAQEPERETGSYPELAAEPHRRELLAHVAVALCEGASPLRHRPEIEELLASMLRLGGGAEDPPPIVRELEALRSVLAEQLTAWASSAPGGMPPVPDALATAECLAGIHQELRQLTLEVYRRERRASDERAWGRVQQFADMLSHALNQPLNAALLTTQLLEFTDATMRSPETRALLEQLRRNLLRTDAVLRDAREAALSRARTANGGHCAFGQVLGEVLAELNGELGARGLRVVVEDPVASVVVPHGRVHLVLTSLLRHLMHTLMGEEGEGVIRVACAPDPLRGDWFVLVSAAGAKRGTSPALDGALAPMSVGGAAWPAGAEDGGQRLGTPPAVVLAREEIELLGSEPDMDGGSAAVAFRFRLPLADTPGT